MSISSVVFYAFAALSIVSALWVVTSRNTFHSAIALTVTLSVVAGFYALVGADFLASAQLLVYVGGIMIIMLFVIMFSQRPLDALQRQTNHQWPWGLLFAVAIGCRLVISFREVYRGPSVSETVVPTSASLGRLLMGDLIVPFEAVSLVLLAALIGAVLFSQDPQEPEEFVSK